jgi:hypothetical protein
MEKEFLVIGDWICLRFGICNLEFFQIGVSSSGKTQVFGTWTRRFESSHPSQTITGNGEEEIGNRPC